MRITSISAYTVKSPVGYRFSGKASEQARLPGSDYLRFSPFPQLYSSSAEALLVRVETDEGITGWGESQAPVAPEIAQSIVARVIGPAVLGRDPTEPNARFLDMFETMRVRGHGGGYQVDAIAGIDIALWDITGRSAGRSVSDLLGGRLRSALPCYVTGLRGASLDERRAEAQAWAAAGIGVKVCLGFGPREDINEIEAIRGAIGDDGVLMVDGLWRYTVAEALRVGRACERNGVEFLEAPLPPEDIAGHARLCSTLDVAIAAGEQLRTRYEFLPWLQAGAVGIAQPDVTRNGITETTRIASLAEAFSTQVALHAGCLTVVGMAATWQVAAVLPNLRIQEHQPVMLDTFNPWLAAPLTVRDGKLDVPRGPGLGITPDLSRIEECVDSVVTVTERDRP